MAERSLQEHRSLIIALYRQGFPEEEIAEELCLGGVETKFSEILQCLEAWHVISCPSPVHSNDTDTDNADDQPPKTPGLKLGVTCHHGENSHPSAISIANIPCDAKPVEKYQQDQQSHEELAVGFPISEEERARRLESLIVDSIIDGISDADSELENEIQQDIKRRRQKQRRQRICPPVGGSRKPNHLEYRLRPDGVLRPDSVSKKSRRQSSG